MTSDGIQAVADELGVHPAELAQAVLRHTSHGELSVASDDATRRKIPEGFASRFGVTVRAARTRRRWTQQRLASEISAALGRAVPTLAISRTEAGSRPTPLLEVAALVLVLDLSVDRLVKEQEQGGGEAQ